MAMINPKPIQSKLVWANRTKGKSDLERKDGVLFCLLQVPTCSSIGLRRVGASMLVEFSWLRLLKLCNVKDNGPACRGRTEHLASHSVIGRAGAPHSNLASLKR